MPSRTFVWDLAHWRLRAEETRTIMRRIALDYDRLAKIAEVQLIDQEEERLDRKLDGLMMVVGWITGVICDFAGGVATCGLRSEIGSGADYQRNCQNTASRTTTRAIIKLISAHKLPFRCRLCCRFAWS